SECVPISYNLPGRTKLGSVGPVVPGLDVKIADDGEILVRGPGVFLGYFKDPEATRAALVDGWLHTGDIGELDREGFLSITGRKKELLITAGGHNIAPKNLEAGIKQCAIVAEVVVIGDRRKYLTALVTLDPDAKSSDPRAEIQTAIDRVNASVARSEQIKKFAILPRPFAVETGELTPTMKIKRNVVAKNFAPEIDEMYPADE
ncbi:MAG: AMP-binding protein, partial [Deltaproteobacteria bacterium]|nr:AMP-binding protein [Deltaproteobacteria bacterium]